MGKADTGGGPTNTHFTGSVKTYDSTVNGLMVPMTRWVDGEAVRIEDRPVQLGPEHGLFLGRAP